MNRTDPDLDLEMANKELTDLRRRFAEASASLERSNLEQVGLATQLQVAQRELTDLRRVAAERDLWKAEVVARYEWNAGVYGAAMKLAQAKRAREDAGFFVDVNPAN